MIGGLSVVIRHTLESPSHSTNARSVERQTGNKPMRDQEDIGLLMAGKGRGQAAIIEQDAAIKALSEAGYKIVVDANFVIERILK